LVLLCTAALIFFPGCADPAKKTGKFTEEEMANMPFAKRDLPDISDGLVLSVDTDTVTVDEVLTPRLMELLASFDRTELKTFVAQARPVIRDRVVEEVTGILLYKEAKKNAPANIDTQLEKAVKTEENKFLALHGNNWAQAQKALAEQGMDLEQFREMKKKMLLTQSYYLSQNIWQEEPITHSEMLAYYEAMKRDGFEFRGILTAKDVKWESMIHFRLIDIDSQKLDFDEINVDALESRHAAALRKAKGLIAQLNDEADFAELAKKHSHDAFRGPKGGLWTPVTEGSPLVGRWAVLQDKAEKMEIGQIAGPIESDGHVFIMKLEDKEAGGVASFADLQKKIEYDIREIRQREKVNKLVTKLLERANISNLDLFINFCTKRAWRQKDAQEDTELSKAE
jgi:parvulin-like peptidyl-prolyl isomerase